MKSTREEKTYKSPQRKLVTFFEKSRNQWKSKCRDAKAEVKRLKNRIRFLERSKADLKRRVQELEDELARMKRTERAREKELEKLKRKTAQGRKGPGQAEAFALVPSHHTYSLGHIMLFVSLVLSAATSFRGASRVIEIVRSWSRLGRPSPSWVSGRLWLLRLGYYKLTRAKEKAEDWVWVVDHTVQLGAEKCLVILGLRLCDLPAAGTCLSHEDVEPLALLPVKHSDSQVVWQQLEETIDRTGVPREIVGDHGSDLKAGVEKFCHAHPETCYIYDIKHKTAAVLKHQLQDDETWGEFTGLAAQTRKRVQQTSLASLAPPNQRTRARYMNVDMLIRWGRKMLTFLDRQEPETHDAFDPERVQEKLGWITAFREELQEWEELLQIITTTERFVRREGLSQKCHLQLKKRLVLQAHTERTQQVRAELVAFVAEESLKVKPHERLLGSSEVIESVFGKLKRLEQDQSKSGFTGLLLSLAAMVSTTTSEVVQQALETVRTEQVLGWCQKTLGPSLQAKRREAFASPEKTERKWDQLRVAA